MASLNPGLESAFKKTEALLKGIKVRHLYIGGLAVLATGEPRMTQDVDLILFVPKSNMEPLFDAAHRHGFTVNRRQGIQDAANQGACTIAYGGVRVDFIFASTDLEESAWRRRVRKTLFKLVVHVPSPEDLILLKLVPGRPRDLEDIRGIAASAGNRLDRTYLKSWAQRLCDRAEDMRFMRHLRETGVLKT